MLISKQGMVVESGEEPRPSHYCHVYPFEGVHAIHARAGTDYCGAKRVCSAWVYQVSFELYHITKCEHGGFSLSRTQLVKSLNSYHTIVFIGNLHITKATPINNIDGKCHELLELV